MNQAVVEDRAVVANQTVIETTHLKKSFGKKDVLNGVDLSIPRGMVVGLLGTNGSGKSMLLKCLLGLLRATGGPASLFGEDSWDISAETKARIGYVPQELKLFPWMRVDHLVQYTASFYAGWDHDFVNNLLTEWNVPRKDRVGPLSPGQLHKLGIILALGHRPEMLILDEPVASLDPAARRDFLKSLIEVSQDESRTVLFSTHITSDLERVASHVAILKNGRISFFGELDELKDSVKRLRITTTKPLPAGFAVSGALRVEVRGCNALVAVPSISSSLVDGLRSKWDADVQIEDLNLEEIFLELNDA